MSQPAPQIHADQPLSSNRTARIMLFAIRRMASFGLNDAHAAHGVFAHFGLGYRRPLILARTMMAEISRTSARTLAVAPCCCARLTRDEAALIAGLSCAVRDPAEAHGILDDLLGTPHCVGVVTTMQALGQACFECGKPLEMFGR